MKIAMPIPTQPRIDDTLKCAGQLSREGHQIFRCI